MCPRKERNSPFRRHQLEAVAPSWGSGLAGSRECNKGATKVSLCPALGSPSNFFSRISWFAWATITEHQRLCGLNHEIYFLTVVEVRSPRSRCQQVWCLLRPLSLACRGPPSHCVLTWPFRCVCTSFVSLPASSWKIFLMQVLLAHQALALEDGVYPEGRPS